MKPNTNYTVPMARKTNTTSMNKVYSWAVLLIATAFFSLNISVVNAQCLDGESGNYLPITSVKKSEFSVYGFNKTEGVKFPISYVVRAEGSEEKLYAGVLLRNPDVIDPNTKAPINITNLKVGNYVILFCDNSSTPKLVTREFTISKSK